MNNNNDLKVVKIKNISDFEFTPALGAMFDSRPVFGKNGRSIEVGEELLMPYHVGYRVAVNLAKYMLLQGDSAPEYGKGDPSAHKAIFTDDAVKELVRKIISDQYEEETPIEETETEKLMKKFDELNKVVEGLAGAKVTVEGYKDKSEIIAELEKRGIPHDKRSNKATLEELLK